MSEATNSLEVIMLGPNTVTQCTQCGKPAVAYMETEQGRVKGCRHHVELAMLHFMNAHKIRDWSR